MGDTMNATANVDPNEIAKFSELAHRWWDPTSEFRPLHEINPLRLDWIIAQCGGLAGKRVVDVGCGGGILTEAMAHAGAEVTGIDLSEKALTVAKLHALESGAPVHYEMIAAEAFAEMHPDTFDVVTCMEMLEHVPDPASTIRACAKLAKPGGTVCFASLNRTAKSYLFAIIGAEYLLQLLPKGTHDWRKFLKPAEITAWAETAGLTPKAIIGMGYNPLTKRYFLTDDVAVNYLIALAKW
ncbi:bifunctional 3-demethylubiquinone 3-O-methyltransferase/2-octaprenyl-6-hydroxy phenol methylase [Hydrogenophilus hirschii]|nr:ubiquinone biosynthesis O-methyltransferase [Hydrogenophilus thermoluteolus]